MISSSKATSLYPVDVSHVLFDKVSMALPFLFSNFWCGSMLLLLLLLLNNGRCVVSS
jgi:hypothetical protein